ncbi:MAG: hypothetical protein CM15mP65_15030 [Crocinitomicaceae bacterium]|nr:MAG: hypothetical protein CM15mP65_15030 [Crocinitomicaceae bacterium]
MEGNTQINQILIDPNEWKIKDKCYFSFTLLVRQSEITIFKH